MATGGAEEFGYSLVKVDTVTLQKTRTSSISSILICQNKLIAIDDFYGKVRIHRLNDGKFLDMLDTEFTPFGMCLMDATTICVVFENGQIQMVSITYEDISPVFLKFKSVDLLKVFEVSRHVVTVNDKFVVVGVNKDMLEWCIASLDDGHVDTIQPICNESNWSDVTTKDNIIYIVCHAEDAADTGVYRFDIFNPSERKIVYNHERLHKPKSIVINEAGNIFIGDIVHPVSCIHQLTASCQPVAIFPLDGLKRDLVGMCWYNGQIYVASTLSDCITIFQHLYEGNHNESEVLLSDEGKQASIVESAIQISHGNMDIGQSNVESEKSPPGPSPEDSEDGTQENHTDSEVPNSDEEKQPVIEGTSTQIGQEIPIEQSVEENLKHAGIQMSTEERDLFIKFQNEIGTDIYFSEVPHKLIDSQESIKTTERFIEQNHPDMKDSWLEYKSQGKLTLELIDVIYAKARNPELHDRKDEILGQMEKLNIIVKAMSFDENGIKEENYFFTPCMLRPKSETEVVAPDKDPRLLSKTLCWDFTGTCVPSSILDRLLAACIKRWPVAKKKETSKQLLSPGYAVFDLDLTHRLTVHCENHDILATVTWLVIDDIETPDENVCTIVRRFISNKLSMITRSLNQNLQYEMYLHSPDARIRFAHIGMWFKDEIYDPESPMTREHINHARLYIALVTVCGNALRYILVDNFPIPFVDIYQAILGNHTKLTKTKGRPLLNKEQINIVFPDPLFQETGTVDKFDITLLYTLIRNVSSVQAPTQGWGNDPLSSDTNLGDSVERIRIYRNHIGGHSPDAKIDEKNFKDYWTKFEDVLHDIEVVTNIKVYTTALDRLKGQVISIFNAG